MSDPSCPPGLKKPNAGAVAAYLREVLGLSTAELIATGVQLESRLSTAALAGSAEYKVPGDRDLVVFQIQSSFRSTDLSTEPVLNANIALDMDGLAEARLSNCIAQLRIKDRSLDIFDNGGISLGGARKSPLYFPQVAPLLIPSGVILQATFALQSAVAANVGNAAYYGLLLTGVAIPKRV